MTTTTADKGEQECREAFERELLKKYPSAKNIKRADGTYIGHMQLLWEFWQVASSKNIVATKVLEDIKMALSPAPYNASYVEFAKECRQALNRRPINEGESILPLTESKTQAIIERGYKITGHVLTHDDGRKAISDMQAVRWLEQGEFWKLMHPAQDNIEGKLGMVPEPFGYFRCTLDGWIDCAETDEGARPLYEYAEIAKRDAEIADQQAWRKVAEDHLGFYLAELVILRAKLEAADGLVEALRFIQHQSEGQRVWAGMEYKYPYPHKRIFDKCEEAITRYQAAQKERKEITQ